MNKTKFIPLLFIFLTSCMDGRAAHENALAFSREMLGMKNPKAMCQNVDSDGDGYVSCTVVEQSPEKGQTVHPVGLDCSGWLSFNNSCRLRGMPTF